MSLHHQIPFLCSRRSSYKTNDPYIKSCRSLGGDFHAQDLSDVAELLSQLIPSTIIPNQDAWAVGQITIA